MSVPDLSFFGGVLTERPSAFCPAWFCPGPLLQSVWGPLFRSFPALPWRRERWDTPDGDFLDLDFLEPQRPGAPTLLALHGLEGSSASHYIQGAASEAARRGWGVVALNFRSCSGEPNRTPRYYHSGETEDLQFVVDRLAGRLKGPLLLVGFSLGGNVLLKWLGERGGELPAAVKGAAAVSAPFAPGESARRLDSFGGVIFRWNLLSSLRSKCRNFALRYPDMLDPERVLHIKRISELDRWYTAPLHGFADEEDYYARSSCLGYLPGIRVPTLLLSAADDPIVPASTFPAEKVQGSSWLKGELLPRGGHVGFVSGRSPHAPVYWAEARAAAFLAGCTGEEEG